MVLQMIARVFLGMGKRPEKERGETIKGIAALEKRYARKEITEGEYYLERGELEKSLIIADLEISLEKIDSRISALVKKYGRPKDSEIQAKVDVLVAKANREISSVNGGRGLFIQGKVGKDSFRMSLVQAQSELIDAEHDLEKLFERRSRSEEVTRILAEAKEKLKHAKENPQAGAHKKADARGHKGHERKGHGNGQNKKHETINVPKHVSTKLEHPKKERKYKHYFDA